MVDYVGIAADEQHRFDTQKRQVGKRMPLVEWGMTEADCLQYCHDRGFYWIERSTATVSGYVDLYDILDRVSCWCCANKNINSKSYRKELSAHLRDFTRERHEAFLSLRNDLKKRKRGAKKNGSSKHQ